jgi:hypothetical protein
VDEKNPLLVPVEAADRRLRLSAISSFADSGIFNDDSNNNEQQCGDGGADALAAAAVIDFEELERRTQAVKAMDVYTGELISNK